MFKLFKGLLSFFDKIKVTVTWLLFFVDVLRYAYTRAKELGLHNLESLEQVNPPVSASNDEKE